MDSSKIQTILDDGQKALSLMGATAELLAAWTAQGKRDISQMLTGDPLTDLAVIRAAGIEDTIKNKFSIDLEDLARFIGLLIEIGIAFAPKK